MFYQIRYILLIPYFIDPLGQIQFEPAIQGGKVAAQGYEYIKLKKRPNSLRFFFLFVFCSAFIFQYNQQKSMLMHRPHAFIHTCVQFTLHIFLKGNIFWCPPLRQ